MDSKTQNGSQRQSNKSGFYSSKVANFVARLWPQIAPQSETMIEGKSGGDIEQDSLE